MFYTLPLHHKVTSQQKLKQKLSVDQLYMNYYLYCVLLMLQVGQNGRGNSEARVKLWHTQIYLTEIRFIRAD